MSSKILVFGMHLAAVCAVIAASLLSLPADAQPGGHRYIGGYDQTVYGLHADAWFKTQCCPAAEVEEEDSYVHIESHRRKQVCPGESSCRPQRCVPVSVPVQDGRGGWVWGSVLDCH